MNIDNNFRGDESNEHDGRAKLLTADADTIMRYIRQSDYRDHNLLVYYCLGEFEEIYIESCRDAIMNRNEIFILATYYQDAASVRKKLHREGIDTTRYESNGTLVLLDSEKAYRHASLSEAFQLTRRAEQLGKNGVTVFGDLGPFILSKRLADLVSHEVSLFNALTVKIRAFCCYHKDDFETLGQEQKQRILAVHSNNFITA
jgi:hypothetical protein